MHPAASRQSLAWTNISNGLQLWTNLTLQTNWTSLTCRPTAQQWWAARLVNNGKRQWCCWRNPQSVSLETWFDTIWLAELHFKITPLQRYAKSNWAVIERERETERLREREGERERGSEREGEREREREAERERERERRREGEKERRREGEKERRREGEKERRREGEKERRREGEKERRREGEKERRREREEGDDANQIDYVILAICCLVGSIWAQMLLKYFLRCDEAQSPPCADQFLPDRLRQSDRLGSRCVVVPRLQQVTTISWPIAAQAKRDSFKSAQGMFRNVSNMVQSGITFIRVKIYGYYIYIYMCS